MSITTTAAVAGVAAKGGKVHLTMAGPPPV